MPPMRAPSVNDSVKRDKSLKVRIKVGSDNLSIRKNAEIYSGLGLDVSPSSLDDSPTDSEGLSCEPQDAPDESPTSILQIMTSFPVHGGLLLSPLSDDLIRLKEKEKFRGESRSGLVYKGGHENSVMSVNGSDFARVGGKVLGDKKPKSFEKNSSSIELKNGHGNDSWNDIGIILKKETDIEILACEELVSNALKLPLLSNSYCNVVESTKGTGSEVDISRTANKGAVKDECFSNGAKEETMEPVSPQDIGWFEKLSGKDGSAGKICEDKKANSHDDFSVYLRKDSNFKGEKTDGFSKADPNVPKGRKAQNAELIDPPKQKGSQKAMSHEEDDMKLAPGREHSSSGGKKKSKGSQSRGAQGAELSKDSLRIDSSLVPKNKKSTHSDNYLSKSAVDDFKLQKDYGNARDRYRDFFGEIELEQGDNDVDSVDMPSADRLKDFEVVQKGTFEFNRTPKEKLNDKKFDKPSTSKACPKMASNVALVTGNGSISDAAPGTVAPLVEDNWVCCDKCQKWRLLPLGTNPDSLPEKWLCSMLDWLPGMNRCSISEEETTKALTALYPVPAPDSQNNLHVHPGGVVSGLPMSDARHFGQNHQNLGSQAVPSGGKKKQGLKEVSNATNSDDLSQFPNLMKNLQASVKSRSLNGVNQSPPVNELDLRHLSKASGMEVDKNRHKQEKNRLLEHHSDGGDTRSYKMKSKRETDQDCFRASKKIKINGHRKDRRKYNDRSSSKSSKRDTKNSLEVPVRNPKDKAQVTSDDGSLHTGKCDDKDIVARKRKGNECQDNQIYAASLPSAGIHLQDSRDFVEETSENDQRKEKKARVSKSEGKETSAASKGTGGTAKNGRSMKDQQLGPDLGFTLSQRDLISIQPSVAATSSSSKVSGSHKNIANIQEVKGSPVESVSSSPLRILNPNPDKSTSARRKLSGKDDFQDSGFLTTGTPRRCSDGEGDGGSNRSGTIKKDETFAVTHHGSLESSVLDFQDRDIANLCLTTSGHASQYPCKPQTLDQSCDEERGGDSQCRANASRPRKSGKGSSSRSKDKNGSSKPEYDKGKIKISDSFNKSIDITPYEEKSRAGKNRAEEKFGVNFDKVEKNSVSKKSSAGKSIGSCKRENQSKLGGHDGMDVKLDAISSQDQKQNLLLDRDSSGRGKSHSLPPSRRGQNETGLRCPQLIPGSQKENGANSLSVDADDDDDALKASKQLKKAENQNGNQPINSRHPTPNGHKVRDGDAPSPIRRDSSSQAATNAVKEAKDLKHLADRLKNSGSSLESTGLYFQAALKFLHGASLLESCNSESAKHGEMIQSMQMYSSTAKLCEFCAHEYEKSKDMAAAALAYKCMEVAYLRVIYSSHTSASRDRHELQTALQIVPPGESPSSSASDVDNLNNLTTVDKGVLVKGVSSPQVAGSHFTAARNRSNFVHLLNFARDVNFAMEASKKSQIAFAAANLRVQEAQCRNSITSVKRALDFNFQNVEGLLRLVRLAMEAISR
ncbi:hypothetical protein F0562_021368 [Nyssa sinensis]|uniref:CW-type domain-containing protein n=1 Tax=Nyssa sinensis TaxID=561372 RepID=A0A5J5BMY2_9ASTE|nr:hypothetical protein F0562_021368 [Nyssa sinensis]